MRSGSYGVLAVLAVAACGGGNATGPGAATTTGYTSDQVAMGQELYAKNCAGCHGDKGQGTTKAPPVVGSGSLPDTPPATAKVRKTEFRTAKDVLDFIKTSMPANKPGSLSAEQYDAILAFDLKANGVDLRQVHIDASTAPTIMLHP